MSGNDTYIRRVILQAIVYGIFALLALRVGYIQLFDSKYKSLADGNVLRYEVLYAPRGEIIDRNGEYLVQSKECYDLMVTYSDLEPEGFDTLSVCEIVDIDKQKLTKSLDKIKNDPYMRLRPERVANYVPVDAKLRLEELSIPGFSFVSRTIRWYPRKIAGNVLGYLQEVNEKTIKRDQYYKMGDYHGITALEAAYERELRGIRGTGRPRLPSGT